jgi:hypothetical protein
VKVAHSRTDPFSTGHFPLAAIQNNRYDPSHTTIIFKTIIMSAYDNYAPLEFSTPTKSRQSTPVTTPTRAALLKPNFMVRGSPIKFSLSTSEKETLKDVDFDVDYDEPEHKRFGICRAISRILLGLLWVLLVASAIYLYLFWIPG